jgi:hypothetical protein
MMAMQNNCFQLLGAIKVGGTAAAMCTNIVACVGTTKMIEQNCCPPRTSCHSNQI